jgi:hypothetical protein
VNASVNCMLVIEPEEEAARVDATGFQFLGIEATRRAGWPTLRHVFDVGDVDAGLFVEVGPFGAPEAYAVGYDALANELLTAL